MGEWEQTVAMHHKEGEERARRKIAKKLKGTHIFTDEYIADIVELDIKTIKRLKEEVQ